MADYETIEYIQGVIKQLLEKSGIQARVDYEDSLVSGLVFNISSRDAKLLIGQQGSTLYALEHIVHAMVSRQLSKKAVSEGKDERDARIFFSIDVDDYKKNRQYQLKQAIKEEIAKMKRSGQPGRSPALPKYERKFVHMYIQEQFPHVTTESIGTEPNRYIKMKI